MQIRKNIWIIILIALLVIAIIAVCIIAFFPRSQQDYHLQDLSGTEATMISFAEKINGEDEEPYLDMDQEEILKHEHLVKDTQLKLFYKTPITYNLFVSRFDSSELVAGEPKSLSQERCNAESPSDYVCTSSETRMGEIDIDIQSPEATGVIIQMQYAYNNKNDDLIYGSISCVL